MIIIVLLIINHNLSINEIKNQEESVWCNSSWCSIRQIRYVLLQEESKTVVNRSGDASKLNDNESEEEKNELEIVQKNGKKYNEYKAKKKSSKERQVERQ